MSGPIKFKDVDFFGLKLLSNKDCRFCVRSGTAFMYIDNQRFDFENTPQEFDVTKYTLTIEAVNMDLSKDVTVEGFIYFWQSEEYYAAAIIDNKRKHSPMIIRAGNSLEEMENKND